jgi:hypothetical protein
VANKLTLREARAAATGSLVWQWDDDHAQRVPAWGKREKGKDTL